MKPTALIALISFLVGCAGRESGTLGDSGTVGAGTVTGDASDPRITTPRSSASTTSDTSGTSMSGGASTGGNGGSSAGVNGGTPAGSR